MSLTITDHHGKILTEVKYDKKKINECILAAFEPEHPMTEEQIKFAFLKGIEQYVEGNLKIEDIGNLAYRLAFDYSKTYSKVNSSWMDQELLKNLLDHVDLGYQSYHARKGQKTAKNFVASSDKNIRAYFKKNRTFFQTYR